MTNPVLIGRWPAALISRVIFSESGAANYSVAIAIEHGISGLFNVMRPRWMVAGVFSVAVLAVWAVLPASARDPFGNNSNPFTVGNGPFGPSNPHPFHVDPMNPNPFDAGPFKVGSSNPFKVGPMNPNPLEPDPFKAGAFKRRAFDVDPLNPDPFKIGPFKRKPFDVEPLNPEPFKIGPFKRKPFDVEPPNSDRSGQP